MITCHVKGPSEIDGHYLAGLGNQIFTIAATLAHAADNNDEAVFPDLQNRDWFGPYVDTIFRNLNIEGDKSFCKHLYRERSWKHQDLPYASDLCLDGYFQSYKYFEHQRELILETFSIPAEIKAHIESKYADILTLDNTVAVHVRRGDFLTPRLSQYHYEQKPEYYIEATSTFGEDSTFVFFSDDIEWCKLTFGDKIKNVRFIEGETDVVDLYFMSLLNNNIIGNSTFSFWGAWLNQSENKRVIAPKKWYGPKNAHLEDHEIIPPTWEVMG